MATKVITGQRATTAYFSALEIAYVRELKIAMKGAMEYVKAAVQSPTYTDGTYHDVTGMLRANTTTDVRVMRDSIEGTVDIRQPYARPVAARGPWPQNTTEPSVQVVMEELSRGLERAQS